MRRLLALLVPVLVVVAALAVGATRAEGPVTDAERASAIAGTVRCPTCRGQSVASSDAPAAAQIRAEIDRRVAAGEGDDEVRAALVAAYGDGILLNPPSSGVAGLVWALPVAGFVVAGAALVLALRRWRADRGRPPARRRGHAAPPGGRRRAHLMAAHPGTGRRPAAGDRPAAVSRGRRLDPDALADLEEQRDLLLRSLDDLDREHAAGELDEADHAVLREEATRRAAEVLRAIETGRSALAARPPVDRRRVAVAGAAVAVLAVASGMAVAASSGTREAGESATGEVRDLTDDRLVEASRLARGGDVQGALGLYDAVLEDDPANVEALSERGLLLASLSDAADLPDLLDSGRASVEQALAVDPGNPRPLFYLGLIQRLAGEDEAATATLRQALAADPPPELRRNIELFLGGGDAGQPPPEPEAAG